jgi:hypothetical protein
VLRLAGGIIALMAGGVAVFETANWLIADSGRQHYAGIVLASAEGWPEIKNGVPELRSSSPAHLTPGSGDNQQGNPALVNVGRPEPSVTSSTRSAIDPAASQAASHPLHGSAPDSVPSTASGRFFDFATVERQGAGHAGAHRERVSGGRPDSLTAGSAGELGSPQDAKAGARTETPNRTDRAAAPGGRTKERPIERVAAQTVPQPRKPSRATSKAKLAGRTKAASKPRVRTAATRVATAPTTGAAAAPAPPEERARLLGLPLPTGREIKQCLFEFRC